VSNISFDKMFMKILKMDQTTENKPVLCNIQGFLLRFITQTQKIGLSESRSKFCNKYANCGLNIVASEQCGFGKGISTDNTAYKL
jgi:hypothetical protein